MTITHFLDTLSASVQLTSQERDVLIQTGVTSHEELHSLTMAFPESLERAGVRVSLLASISTDHFASSYADQIAVSDDAPFPPFGAIPPADARWDNDGEVEADDATATIDITSSLRANPPIDLSKGLDWPIKDQAGRGTCVAFAVAAAVERIQSGPWTAPKKLSEQFLYWGIKEKGSEYGKRHDGASLSAASAALSDYGVCDERYWRYNPRFISGNAGQGGDGNPSYTALSEGKRNRMSSESKSFYGQSGGAAMVLAALQSGRAVALGLPSFSDRDSSTSCWSTPVARAYGRILNPPPGARRNGGHAICITGFHPDPYEPMGGYFIFRNSWGTRWASRAPATGHSYAPAPGYGDVSATFVEKYNWEIMKFAS